MPNVGKSHCVIVSTRTAEVDGYNGPEVESDSDLGSISENFSTDTLAISSHVALRYLKLAAIVQE